MAKAKKVATPTPPSTADLVRQRMAALDQGKAGYARADALFDQIRDAVSVGESIDLGNGQTAVVVDQFATKNKVWKPCGVSRFDIEVTQR